jgi:pimeloyl-ACP methyl ester carboxylesterase
LTNDHQSDPADGQAPLTRLPVSADGPARALAVRARPGRGPAIVWLGGFRSDMDSTKALALDTYAAREGRACLRFDYAGHGISEGDFAACTISTWLADALAVLEAHGGERPVLVGSSMGGWIALRVCQMLQDAPPERRPGGLVLIAPAVDFTQVLMWERFPQEIRDQIEREGVWLRPSAYSPEPYPITRELIEDGRRHLMLGGPINPGCPVHILQGMQDPDVPYSHALLLMEHLAGTDASLTLIKDGDHRLSRDADIALLVRSVAAMVEA